MSDLSALKDQLELMCVVPTQVNPKFNPYLLEHSGKEIYEGMNYYNDMKALMFLQQERTSPPMKSAAKLHNEDVLSKLRALMAMMHAYTDTDEEATREDLQGALDQLYSIEASALSVDKSLDEE